VRQGTQEKVQEDSGKVLRENVIIFRAPDEDFGIAAILWYSVLCHRIFGGIKKRRKSGEKQEKACSEDIGGESALNSFNTLIL
jgi:hypothetical protein